MCSMYKDLHGGEKPKVPVKLHPDTKALKVEISTFVMTHCTFICEIPATFGVETPLRESSIISPYSFCKVRKRNTINHASIEKDSKVIAIEAKPLFNDIHNTLCQEAPEVLVFMLSDHNRHHHEFFPYSLPLGYAMKGKNMSNKDHRYLDDKCRNKLHENNILVFCEVYNGQWQNIRMTCADGSPLTELCVIKPTWQKVQKMSKEKCLQEMILASKICQCDLETMSSADKLMYSNTHYHNLKITRNADSTVDVISTGGVTFTEPAIQYLHSVTKQNHPDLWIQTDTELQEVENGEEENVKRKRSTACGLTESERSIVHLLDSEIIRDLQDSVGENIMGDEASESVQNEYNIDFEK